MTRPPHEDERQEGREDAVEARTDATASDGLDRRTFIGVSIGAVPVLGGAAAGARVARTSGPSGIGGAAAAGAIPVALRVNGVERKLILDPRVTLLEALREDLALTGTKEGCDHGQCGACTVLINGRRVNSCLTLAIVHEGEEITTIEGLAQGDQLHPMQAAFVEHDGFQCGYCTPGQICSAVACVQEGHAKDDAQIREWMSGNLCRCGAYPNIVDAIKEARGKMGGAA